MPQKNVIQPLESDRYFHIYNRGIDGQKIFSDDSDYLFFLQKYQTYLSRYVYTLAYCLIPNHFHFFIKTRKSRSKKYHLKVSNQFRRLFISYSLHFNRQENRMGNLCTRHFRRIIIDKDEYLQNILFYIHYNSQKHQIISDFRLYQYSSYNQMFKKWPNFIDRDFVLGFFNGNIEEYKEFHMELLREKSRVEPEEESGNVLEMASHL